MLQRIILISILFSFASFAVEAQTDFTLNLGVKKNYTNNSLGIGLKIKHKKLEVEPQLAIHINSIHNDNQNYVDFHRAHAYFNYQYLGFGLNGKYFIIKPFVYNKLRVEPHIFMEGTYTNLGRLSRRTYIIGDDINGNPIREERLDSILDPIPTYTLAIGAGTDIYYGKHFGVTCHAGLGPVIAYNKYLVFSPIYEYFIGSLYLGLLYRF